MENYKLTKHFSFFEMTNTSHIAFLKENREKGSDPEIVKKLRQLCKMLETIRAHTRGPMTILSGFRSKKLNKYIKGSKTSQHKLGEAADWVAGGKNMLAIFNKLQVILKGYGQMIWYPDANFIHISLPRKNKPNEQIMKYKDGKYIILKQGRIA